MTEQQIEVEVQRRTDALDRRYLSTAMSEADYKAACAEIDAWAKQALRAGGVR